MESIFSSEGIFLMYKDITETNYKKKEKLDKPNNISYQQKTHIKSNLSLQWH